MSKYHKYVFDIARRKFVGKFEEMYKNESKKIFDSWHQEDSRQLQRKIDLDILEDYNFGCIVDLGCGKGGFSHLLKKRNNRVIGLDISTTAVAMAKERYPDIDFQVLNVNHTKRLDQWLTSIEKNSTIDLIFTSELLSYIKNWKEVIEIIARHTQHFLISLFIPENPIGFVKNEDELIEEIEKHFKITEHISVRKSLFTVVFCSKKNEL